MTIRRFTMRSLAARTLVAVLCLAGAQAYAAVVTFELIIDNTWSEATHPDAHAGIVDPHFSHIGGATHNASASLWAPGSLASPGIIDMATNGGVEILLGEVNSAIAEGSAFNAIIVREQTAAPGARRLRFEVSDSHTLLSLVTMLGPSPDWFVGVSALELRPNGEWLDRLVVDLLPYDGGVRDAAVFELGGPVTTPQAPIRAITEDPLRNRSLGTFTLVRVVVTEPGALMFIAGVLALWLARSRRRFAGSPV